MRTPKYIVNRLMKEAAEAFGCKRGEVFGRMDAIAKAFQPEFQNAGYRTVTISPYKDNVWSISAFTDALDRDGEIMPGSARWMWMPFDVKEMISNPEQFVADFCQVCA